jgi:acylpyruvate hydrolase
VTLLPPVTRSGKIICIGLNYMGHAREQGAEPPETPTFFAMFANALARPGGTVELPKWSGKACATPRFG